MKNIKFEEIPCNYVASFKVGDNLVFNSKILCDLISCNGNEKFNKPIILQAGSITEASLIQIIKRAQNFNREGVPNISEKERQEIEDKKIEKFYVVINILKKYKVLDDLGPNIYDDLHRLREFRNKIHIQDDIKTKDVSKDELEAFSIDECERAINLNYKIIKYLHDKLKRPKHLEGYVSPLTVPKIK